MDKVIITGGEGDLATALAEFFSEEYEVYQPSRESLNVADERSVNAYFAKLSEVNLLVCCAGMVKDRLFFKMSELDWDEVMDVNLKGAYLCAREGAKKMMRAKSGHILFIGSYSGFNPPIGQVNYASSKAGLVGLMKSLASELGEFGVRVNMIVPGWMETKMTREVSQCHVKLAQEQHALGKFNTPERVARFIYMLHRDMIYTSGQTFHLDSRILT